MNISITYCTRWNYLPRASSLAARISKELGIESELIKGDNGIFDVIADGKLLFSKYKSDRYPEEDEVIALLRDAGG